MWMLPDSIYTLALTNEDYLWFAAESSSLPAVFILNWFEIRYWKILTNNTYKPFSAWFPLKGHTHITKPVAGGLVM